MSLFMEAPDPEAAAEVVIAIGARIRALRREEKEPTAGLIQHARNLIEVRNGQLGTEGDIAELAGVLEAYARRNGREFFTRQEVAAMSGKSPKTVGRLIARGDLFESPLGIPATELDRLTGGRA